MLRALREQNRVISGKVTVRSYSNPDVTSIIRGSIKEFCAVAQARDLEVIPDREWNKIEEQLGGNRSTAYTLFFEIVDTIKDPSATNTTDIVSNKRFQNVLKTLSTRGSVDDIVDAARACASVATYISKKFG